MFVREVVSRPVGPDNLERLRAVQIAHDAEMVNA